MKKKKNKLIIDVPPTCNEGYWSDLLDEIDKINDFKPSTNNGKWWKQIKLDKLKSKLKYYKK